jgi:hypothetical protein
MDKVYLDAIDAAKKASDAFRGAKTESAIQKASQNLRDLSAEQVRQLGVSGNFLAKMGDLQREHYSMRVDLSNKMSAAEQAAYQGSLDRVFSQYLTQRIEAEKSYTAITSNYKGRLGELDVERTRAVEGHRSGTFMRIAIDKYYDEERRKLDRGYTDSVAKNTQELAMINNRAQVNKLILEQYVGTASADILKQLSEGSIKEENMKYAAMSALQGRFIADSSVMLSAVPEQLKAAATQAQAELQRSYYNQLQAITMSEKMSAVERQKAFQDLETWKAGKLDEFTKLAEEQNKRLTASNGATFQDATNSLSEFTAKVSATAEEAALKTNAAVGSVQKELGVTASEALTNLKDIAAIDPKRFEEQLKVIKAVYIDFATTAQTQTKAMLVETGKAFDEFNTKAAWFWTAQKGNVTNMVLNEEDIKKLSETVGLTVDRALSALTQMISDKIDAAVTSGFTAAFVKVLADTKKFVKDMMAEFKDLAAQMVRQFGDTWMKIMDFTAKSIAALDADTSRALVNLKRIESSMRAALSAKSESAGAEVKQDVKMDIGKSELENIFQATHHPQWYENDFKYKVMEMIAALNGLTAAMGAKPTGGSKSFSVGQQFRESRQTPPGTLGGTFGLTRTGLGQ